MTVTTTPAETPQSENNTPQTTNTKTQNVDQPDNKTKPPESPTMNADTTDIEMGEVTDKGYQAVQTSMFPSRHHLPSIRLRN